MRLLALSLILLAAVNVASAEEVFKVGVTTREFVPAEPYDWRGAATHRLRATIWYSAASDAREQAQCVGPPVAACRDADGVDRDAIHAEAAALALDFFGANLR